VFSHSHVFAHDVTTFDSLAFTRLKTSTLTSAIQGNRASRRHSLLSDVHRGHPMPSLTATAHQALRYFFVGAIAAFLFLFLDEMPPSPWLNRIEHVVNRLDSPGPLVFMLILGTLIYGVHRLLFYPVLYRLMALSVWTPWRNSRMTFGQWWPWGTALPEELRLENRMATTPERIHSRFVGWSSEVHLYYITIEIALLTLWCPGWPLTSGTWYRPALVPVVLSLLLFVWAWDRYLLLLETNLRSTG
jgi:hypothetical protein